MLLTVSIHYSRASDIVHTRSRDQRPVSAPHGLSAMASENWCSRIVAPPGQFRISSNGVVRDLGLPDVIVPSAQQHAVQDLPEETLVFLLGSRYC